MTDTLFWDEDAADLPALELFTPAHALPPLDDFPLSPVIPPPAHLSDALAYADISPDLSTGQLSPEHDLLPPPHAPAPATAVPADFLAFASGPGSSAGTGSGADDEAASERGGSSGRSSQDLASLEPGATLSSTGSELTVGLSAVEAAKRKAEQIANDKASDRKRKSGAGGPAAKRQKGGAEGSSCSDGDDDPTGADDAPEKISHRKYQKRLQKNRDSAYVSRIRRREYARILEDSLEQVESEKNSLHSKYMSLQRRFDVVVQELNTLKEATAKRFGSVAHSIAAPIGAAGAAAQKPAKTGALVTTMFVCALMFGIMLPESLVGKQASSRVSFAEPASAFARTTYPHKWGPQARVADRGRVWGAPGPMLGWAPTGHQQLLQGLAANVTQLLGKEHAGAVMRLLEQRVQDGVVSEKALLEIARKARETVLEDACPDEDADDGDAVPQSRRAALFHMFLRRLAQAADDGFTKELVALVTVRLIPQPGKQLRAV